MRSRAHKHAASREFRNRKLAALPGELERGACSATLARLHTQHLFGRSARPMLAKFAYTFRANPQRVPDFKRDIVWRGDCFKVDVTEFSQAFGETIASALTPPNRHLAKTPQFNQ